MDKWLDHCMYVFGKKEDLQFRAYFERHYKNDPQATLDGIFVAVDNETIVSTVRVFTRRINIYKKSILMGGIGEVSTKSDYQRQGLSNKLLQMSVEYMKKQNMNVSLLFTGVHDHYKKVGWQTLPYNLKKVHVNASEKFPFKLVDGNIKENLRTIKNIYDKFAKDISCSIDRFDDNYWIKWTNDEINDIKLILDGTDIIGYVKFEEHNDNIYVKELVTLPKQYNKIIDLLFPYYTYVLGKENATYTNLPSFSTFNNYKTEEYQENGMMISLITPFEIGTKRINNSSELLNILQKNKTPIYYFNSDGF